MIRNFIQCLPEEQEEIKGLLSLMRLRLSDDMRMSLCMIAQNSPPRIAYTKQEPCGYKDGPAYTTGNLIILNLWNVSIFAIVYAAFVVPYSNEFGPEYSPFCAVWKCNLT